ncbi:DUF2058 domain-containing protein [Dyella sp.]|jgi:uncharacterized protein YaiL (DUF2058 family)|uniref:DUF2058 domain-containing protein n=1 Tax=Dyella sp. TaxID=1869338 RepID=UPI002D7760D6|nr:DUF2058 domain-containing protein [Dyella sp.]HET6432819.1 DUF2058 domain-containing protein [Dyella sp.]
MRNLLQDQLLKAGLVNKAKVNQVAREQNKQKVAKAPPAPPREDAVDHARLQAERAERDRALAAERNAQARAAELRAQVRQIIATHKVKRSGEIDYRFTHDNAIRSVLVNETMRSQLASGALVIVALDDRYELLPRGAAEKVRERDPSAIVLDHAQPAATDTPVSDDDAYYSQFQVPDDLIW